MAVSEFSRIFSLEKVKGNQNTFHVEATADERAALATRFSLPAIHVLKADYVISKGDNDSTFNVEGVITAEVVQSCVVSLADVPASLHFPVKMILTEGEEEEPSEDLEWVFEEIDREFYQSTDIDLGEITAQYLYISLDPYPRSKELPDEKSSEDMAERNNPFSILQNLKK